MRKTNNIQPVEFIQDGGDVELIGLKDESSEAEVRSEQVQDMVARMIDLGQKKGRLRKDESHEDIAA